MSWLIPIILAISVVSTIRHYLSHGDPILPTFLMDWWNICLALFRRLGDQSVRRLKKL